MVNFSGKKLIKTIAGIAITAILAVGRSGETPSQAYEVNAEISV
jgi:hypothetical protein